MPNAMDFFFLLRDIVHSGTLESFGEGELKYLICAAVESNEHLKDSEWPRTVPISTKNMVEMSGLTAKSVRKARDQLHAKKYIKHTKASSRPKRPGKVILRIDEMREYLGSTRYPQEDPSEGEQVTPKRGSKYPSKEGTKYLSHYIDKRIRELENYSPSFQKSRGAQIIAELWHTLRSSWCDAHGVPIDDIFQDADADIATRLLNLFDGPVLDKMNQIQRLLLDFWGSDGSVRVDSFEDYLMMVQAEVNKTKSEKSQVDYDTDDRRDEIQTEDDNAMR